MHQCERQISIGRIVASKSNIRSGLFCSHYALASCTYGANLTTSQMRFKDALWIRRPIPFENSPNAYNSQFERALHSAVK